MANELKGRDQLNSTFEKIIPRIRMVSNSCVFSEILLQKELLIELGKLCKAEKKTSEPFKSLPRLGNLLSDVPDPPDRPLISNFTSRSVRLSWVASRNSHNNPILYYVIETQYEFEALAAVARGTETDKIKGVTRDKNCGVDKHPLFSLASPAP
ncbi:unnamed protein product, partial [Heterotrigona itama]